MKREPTPVSCPLVTHTVFSIQNKLTITLKLLRHLQPCPSISEEGFHLVTAQSLAPTELGKPYALSNYLLNESVTFPESVSVWPQNPTGKPQPANEPRCPQATGTAGRGLGGGATPSASPGLQWRRPAAGVQGSGSPRGRPQSHAPASAPHPAGNLEESACPA